MSNMNKCKGMVSFLNCKFFYKKIHTSYQKDSFLFLLLSKVLKKDKGGWQSLVKPPFFIKEMKKMCIRICRLRRRSLRRSHLLRLRLRLRDHRLHRSHRRRRPLAWRS